MADNQRNKIFAAFIGKQFSNNHPKNILDVACGDGRLAVALSKVFPFAEIVGVDPKPRGNKRKIKFLRGKFPERVKIKQYDLIVGMHPDEATWDIVKQSCYHRIPFSVVPCCLLHTPPFFQKGNMQTWVRFLYEYSNQHNMRTTHTTLPMNGANQVLFGVPK